MTARFDELPRIRHIDLLFMALPDVSSHVAEETED